MSQIAMSESAIRARADARGFRVVKSRARNLHYNDQGQYMLVDNSHNGAVLGGNYDATLQEIADYLT